MASGSTTISGQQLTANVAYEGVLQNYNNTGKDYYLRRIEIQGDGGGYITISQPGATNGTVSASYTWTYPYSSSHTWDSRGYYSEVNTGANGGYDRSVSGSGTIGPAPAPSAPTTPSVSASQSGSTAFFSWSNVSASGYSYSGAASGSTAGTSVSVAGSYGSTYTLYVQAYNTGDGVNTAGTTYSGTGSASVYLAYPPPSTPATPTVSGSYSGTTVYFTWNSTGGSYNVYVNGSYYTSTTSTGLNLAKSLGSTTTCYVQAVNSNSDGVTASSANSNTASVYIPNPPAAPGATTLSGSVSGQTANLSWTNSSATGYYIYRNSTYLTSTTALSYADSGLTKGSTYTYYVVAYNSNSDGTATSANSNTVSEYILNPPAAPSSTTLSGTPNANGDGGVPLSWSAVSCTGYKLTRDGTQIYQGTATSFTDTGLARGSSHSYVCTTYNTNADGTTNGAASNTLTVTIPNFPAAPSAPSLSGSADSTTGYVALTWSNVSATGYDVYRNSSLLAAGVTGTTYTDQATTAQTTYTYYVIPYNVNAVGRTNGTQSNTVSITVPLPPPPAAPPTPTTPTISATAQYQQVTVAWNSTGATGYLVYRNGAQVANTASTSFSESRPAETYTSYYVVPYNTATNAGGSTTTTGTQSNTVTVLTKALPPSSCGVLMG